MVVEDDDDLRSMLSVLLKGEGYGVIEAVHGQDALDKLRLNDRPCLILLDLFMPVVDGAEFRRRQLCENELADIPVVVVSAAVGVEGRIAALNVASHLEKPLDIHTLFETVARYCG